MTKKCRHNIILPILAAVIVILSIVWLLPETKKNGESAKSTELSTVESKGEGYTRIDYVDAEGNITFASDKHYATVIKTLDEAGHNILEEYFDAEGKPARQSAGHYALARKYNENGKAFYVEYLDENGEPTVNTSGYTILMRTYDEAGNVITETYHDENGTPVLTNSGIHGYRYTYNDIGKREYSYCMGLDGNPAAISSGYYGTKRTYDADGNLDKTFYLDADGQIMLTGRMSAGFKTVDGKMRSLDKDGNIKVDIFSILSDYPYIVPILALIMCVIALLLPGKTRYFLLAFVVLVIVHMTLYREMAESAKAFFELFHSYKKFFEAYSTRVEILHNIWLFVPLGAVLYFLFKEKLAMLIPALLSAAIEVTQLGFHLGCFEFDDIISNSIGGLIGVLIGYSLTVLKNRHKGTGGDGSPVSSVTLSGFLPSGND